MTFNEYLKEKNLSLETVGDEITLTAPSQNEALNLAGVVCAVLAGGLGRKATFIEGGPLWAKLAIA